MKRDTAYHTFNQQMIALQSFAATEHLSGDDAALEAIGILGKTLDLFSRFLFNFKTEVFGLLLKFKRSELRAYHESNPMKIRDIFSRIEKMNLASFSVPVPDGMRGTYTQVVSLLSTMSQQAEIESTITDIQKALSVLATANYSRIDPQVTETLRGLTGKISRLSRKDIEDRLGVVFVDGRRGEVKANGVFSTPRDVQKVDTELLRMESLYKTTMRVATESGKLEAGFGAVIDRLARIPSVDVNFLRSLEAFLRAAATQLDLFGVIVHEILRVEHNFTLAMQRIYEQP